MKLSLLVAAGIVFFAAAALLSASPIYGAVLHVRPDGTGEYPTIRAAVLTAVAGDSVMLENGWYYGVDNHNIDFGGRQITVLSASGDPTHCIIDCGMPDPVEERGFFFHSGEDAGSVVDGIGVVNGYAHGTYCYTMGAGILCVNGSSPTIRNCAFKNNDASTGAAAASGQSSPTFYNCLFKDNQSTWTGGGVYLNGPTGTPHFVNCRFVQNTTGYDGGAIVIMSGSPIFDDCEFDANAGGNFGGAVYMSDGNPLFKNCTFRNHVAAYQGGVFYSDHGTNPRLESCTFTGNSAPWGGVSWILDRETFSKCTFVNNGCGYQALIELESGASVSIDHSVLAFSSQGSAVHCLGYSSAAVQCSDIYANPRGDWRWCIEGQYDGFNNISLDPAFCNPEEGDFHLLPGSPLLEGNSPCGRIGAWGPGCEPSYVPVSQTPPPSDIVRVSPNPAPGDCRIEWSGTETRPASIDVFDIAGHRVHSIRDLPPGLNAASWNGRNDRGHPVPSGIYLVRVRAADGNASGALIGTTRVLLTR